MQAIAARTPARTFMFLLARISHRHSKPEATVVTLLNGRSALAPIQVEAPPNIAIDVIPKADAVAVGLVLSLRYGRQRTDSGTVGKVLMPDTRLCIEAS